MAHMKNRVKFKAYKDHLILEADFSYCTKDEMLTAIDELGETLAEQSEGSTLVLKNVEGVRVDIGVINAMKEMWTKYKGKTKKVAICNLRGLQTIARDDVSMNVGIDLPSFDSLEEAREYLIRY